MKADVTDAPLPVPVGMRIMLVHDRPESDLTRTLAREGHDVLTLSDGVAARRLLGVFKPELILLIADDPAIVCRDLRLAAPDTAIVAITHQDSADERISALEAGADDCLGRPFQRQELIARMRAAHRRVQLTLETSPPAPALDQALGLIGTAKRPVIIVGAGARFHRDRVIEMAERIGAPVITTFKAKGQIADGHPLACGVLGRSGTPVASWFMNEADLLIVLGASFSNHTAIYAGKPIVQVDVDPLQLGKFHPVEVPVWGEIGVVVDRLCERISAPPEDRVDQRPELAERWAIWRAEKASREHDDRGRGVLSAAVFAALGSHVPENAVIAVDVGNHAYSFGRYFECKPGQSVLESGYLGSIGFGYPAAIGAWAAAPERPIFAVTGDGGFGQYMAELLTAVKHRMKITHVLLNNGQLGKISKEQRAGDWEVWQTSLHNPDFSKYAEICGALGIRVTNQSQLDDALQAASAHDGPSLIEIVADPDLI